MISAKNRFHGHGSLKYIYRNARPIRSRSFALRALPNPRRKRSRIAVIVSKKTHKSAVGRNRIRRRVYEILRQELNSFVAPHDIALMVTSSEVMTAEHSELLATIRDLLAQASVTRR